MLVAFAIGYTLVFQNPIFVADVNSAFSGGPPHLSVSPYLPSSSAVLWSTAGLSLSCGNGGPGVLQVDNKGSTNVTITAVSLTYGGQTYNSTGTACSVGRGSSVVSITALGAQAGPQGTTFSGYLVASGTRYPFSGTWQ